MVSDEQKGTIEEQVVGEEAPSAELAAVQQALDEQKTLAADYLDQWRRTAADFANYRKRLEREQQQMRIWAAADLLRNLLPVLDDLELAISQLPADGADADWAEGVRLVEHKLQTVLQGTGLQEVEAALGQPFDPNLHEAIAYEQTDLYPEGVIMDRVRRGYKLGEQILRPALVRVAKTPV